MQQNIFLIGMPSSGKSTLGRKLAAQLGYNFVETDDIIVNSQEKSIAEIFAQQGEAYFRTLERDLLHTLGPNQKLVISTGGGMPCFHHNIDYMLQNGLCVYLNVPVQSIYERMISSHKNERPLIDLSDREKLMENLIARHQMRHPIYNRAHIIISQDFTVRHLVAAISNYTSAKG